MAAGCCRGSECANSLIRDMQISKAYSVIPWSHDEAVNIRRALGRRRWGSWSRDVVGYTYWYTLQQQLLTLEVEKWYTGKISIVKTFNLIDL